MALLVKSKSCIKIFDEISVLPCLHPTLETDPYANNLRIKFIAQACH